MKSSRGFDGELNFFRSFAHEIDENFCCKLKREALEWKGLIKWAAVLETCKSLIPRRESRRVERTISTHNRPGSRQYWPRMTPLGPVASPSQPTHRAQTYFSSLVHKPHPLVLRRFSYAFSHCPWSGAQNNEINKNQRVKKRSCSVKQSPGVRLTLKTGPKKKQ